jgi:nucleotide-binding universal stress UspA family protein
MRKFRKILFPVDFSDRCRGAAHYVEALAAHFGSKVTMLHIVETLGRPGDLDFAAMAFEMQVVERTEHFRKVLGSFLAGEMKHLNVERRITYGDPGRIIVSVAEKDNCDLIVMATHGYGGFRRFLLGSMVGKVLHDAPCPVWTGAHLEQSPPAETVKFGNVLCGIDLPVHHEAALKTAADFASEFGAHLTLVHALPVHGIGPGHYMDADLRNRLSEQAREQLAGLYRQLGIQAQVCVEAGDVARAMANAAQQHNADLMVIGRGRHTGLGRLTTHSYAIIRESPCPVLSV